MNKVYEIERTVDKIVGNNQKGLNMIAAKLSMGILDLRVDNYVFVCLNTTSAAKYIELESLDRYVWRYEMILSKEEWLKIRESRFIEYDGEIVAFRIPKEMYNEFKNKRFTQGQLCEILVRAGEEQMIYKGILNEIYGKSRTERG